MSGQIDLSSPNPRLHRTPPAPLSRQPLEGGVVVNRLKDLPGVRCAKLISNALPKSAAAPAASAR